VVSGRRRKAHIAGEDPELPAVLLLQEEGPVRGQALEDPGGPAVVLRNADFPADSVGMGLPGLQDAVHIPFLPMRIPCYHAVM